MPKQALNIKTFQGMIGSTDAHDAPEGSAVFAENIDNIQEQGLFVPLPKDLALTGADQYANADLITPLQDGSKGVQYDQANSAVRVINTNTGETVADDNSYIRYGLFDTAVSDGEAAHVGLGNGPNSKPRWVGNINHEQFGGAAPSTIQFEDAEIKWAECAGIFIDPSTSENDQAFMLPEKNVVGSVNVWDNSQVAFNTGSSYYYYASLVYDGYQEGPLFLIGTLSITDSQVLLAGSGYSASGDTVIQQSTQNTSGSSVMIDYNSNIDASRTVSSSSWRDASTETSTNTPASGLARVDFTLRLRYATLGSTEVLPRRVTRINLYRAEDINGSVRYPYKWYDEQFGISDPLLFQSISVEQGSPSGPKESTWAAVGIGAGNGDYDSANDDYYEIIVKDTGVGYETFTGRTALPLGLNNMQLHYGVSCIAESYHVVARCWHPDLKQIDSWIFKSKPYRYDTFDWSSDYLVLPAPPNALAYWMGKLYAFCDGRTYVINMVSFDIEDTIEGIGAAHKKAITITDRGMFWADTNNIYWHDGNSINPIGNAILRNQYNNDAAWLSRSSNEIVSVYSPRYDSVVFAFGDYQDFGALMFNVGNRTWSYITTDLLVSDQQLTCGYQKQDGEPVLGFADYGGTDIFYHLFGSTTDKRDWRFVSKQFKDGGSKTRYYEVRVSHYGNPPSVYFYADDPDYSNAISNTAEFHTYDVTQYGQAVLWITGGGSSPSGGTGVGLVEETPNSTSIGQLTESLNNWRYLRDFAIEFRGTGEEKASEVAIIYRPLSPR